MVGWLILEACTHVDSLTLDPVWAVACPCPAALAVILQPQPARPPARTHTRTPPSSAVQEELAEQQAPLEPPGAPAWK